MQKITFCASAPQPSLAHRQMHPKRAADRTEMRIPNFKTLKKRRKKRRNES
jgi:hypothetical protein